MGTMSGEHSDDHATAYATVAVALLIFTVITFVAAESFHTTTQRAVSGLLIAVLKASLVAAIFMHLRWDWPKKVWFMVVPALALSVVLLLALFPDIALQPRDKTPYGSWVPSPAVQEVQGVERGPSGH
jgi:caa(3)-type oxidase subunit IV